MPAATAAIIAVVTATPAPAATAAIIAVVSTAPAPAASARRCTVITLNIDQLTGNTGIRQTIKDRAVQVLRQLNQGEVPTDSDATKVLGAQAPLVGERTNDCTRANMLALANIQAVGVEVLRIVVEAAAASTTVITVTPAATAVVAIPPITVLSLIHISEPTRP